VREEVLDLEKAGVGIIQIDEAALREGLPLRQSDWNTYLEWAIEAFRLSANGVEDDTQIHTHMCYSEFNDIIGAIARMDADVITIETSRSAMELLDAFKGFEYPNDIGPGVYDIHSPNIPQTEQVTDLMKKAAERIREVAGSPELKPPVPRRQVFHGELARAGGKLNAGGRRCQQLHAISLLLMDLVDVAPQHHFYLREAIDYVPEVFTIPEPDFSHPVSADINRVVMQRDQRRQIRVLLQNSCEKIQFRFCKLPEYFAGHGSVQKDKLPSALNKVPPICICDNGIEAVTGIYTQQRAICAGHQVRIR
jgi:hypothetical protein